MNFFANLETNIMNFGDNNNNKLNFISIIIAILILALFILLIIYLTKKDNFSNEHTEDIIMVGNMGCPFCKKAKALLDELEIDYMFVDSNSTEGNKHMKEHNSNGVPLIVNNKNNTSIKGFNEPEIRNLKNSNHDNNSENKDIIMVGYMGCPFCKKAKALLDELHIDYMFVDSNSPHGQAHMKKHNSNGVPLIVNNKNNTSIKGFNEPEIRNLKN